jgi:hypothetical protein
MLKLDVDYYNEEHKQLLANAPFHDALEEAIKNGMEIPEEEFEVYTVFREQKQKPGWKSYSELKARLPHRLATFSEYFDLSKGTVRSKFETGSDCDNTQTESAGVGVALAVVSKLYNLTEADWQKIPIQNVKDLDFEIASDGKEMVEVEAKGTVLDGEDITPGISNCKRSIENKKKEQREKQNNRNRLIGIITSFPSTEGQSAKVRVLDPPMLEDPEDPLKYKLLARLYFYWREIRLISESPFLQALINRIGDISFVSDYGSLNDRPLLNLSGEKMQIPISYTLARTILPGEIAFGEVFPLRSDTFFFYGFDMKIVSLLINQRFDEILNFKSNLPDAIQEISTLTARVREEELEGSQVQPSGFPKGPDKSRVEIPMSGRLSANSAGRVFGELTIAES